MSLQKAIDSSNQEALMELLCNLSYDSIMAAIAQVDKSRIGFRQELFSRFYPDIVEYTVSYRNDPDEHIFT